MLTIRHPTPAAATAALFLLLSGCDKLRSTEPPPSFESPTVGVAREISGVTATPPATAPSAPAPAK
jgi:hypothetical protein